MVESKRQHANIKMLSKVMFRLLPIQVFLAAISAVNGILSSYFASNYIGIKAVSAVGLYAPITLLIQAISIMLVGGSVALCGQYRGRNEQDQLQKVFSLDISVSALISGLFLMLFLLLGSLNTTGFITHDAAARSFFNRYLIGQAIGIIPLMTGNQLSAFLSMENKGKLTLLASFLYIAVNLGLNHLFVCVLHLETLGLALASSLGLWVFFLVQIQYFLFGKSHMKLRLKQLPWRETGEIIRVGIPGALCTGYQTARGLIVNWLLEAFVGTVGISALATCNNLLALFWAIPTGMLAVSSMMINVSVKEEDRQTLTDVMRVMFRRYLPLMCVVSAILIACAEPLTRIFFRNPTDPVYMMMVWGLRILPLCMPLSIICTHFSCYGNTSGKNGLVHGLSLMDGLICVVGFTALLIRPLGMNSVYLANVLNGVVVVLIIIAYSCFKVKHVPHSMDELMVIPEEFGAPETERLDLSVKNMKDVLSVSRQIQDFFREKGIDERRAYLSGLAMEEMAGNIVEHGFVKDRKRHSVDVRVVHKDDDVILRLKDDCIPFNPSEQQRFAEGEDRAKNIGIRIVFHTARDIQYQNILGMNVLTIRL